MGAGVAGELDLNPEASCTQGRKPLIHKGVSQISISNTNITAPEGLIRL